MEKTLRGRKKTKWKIYHENIRSKEKGIVATCKL